VPGWTWRLAALLLLCPTASAATLGVGFTFPEEGGVLSGPLRAEGWVTYDPGQDGPYFLPAADGSGPSIPLTLDIQRADGGAEQGGLYLNQPRIYTTSANGTWNASAQGLPVDGLYHLQATATVGNLTATAQRTVHVRNGLWLEVDSVETLPDFDGQPRALRVVGRAGFQPVAVELAVDDRPPTREPSNGTIRLLRHAGLPQRAEVVETTPLADGGFRFVATTSPPEPMGTHWVAPSPSPAPAGNQTGRPRPMSHPPEERSSATMGSRPVDRDGVQSIFVVPTRLEPSEGYVSVHAYRRPPPEPVNGTLAFDFASADGPVSLVRTWEDPVLFQSYPGMRTVTMAPCAEGQEPNPIDGGDPCHQTYTFGGPSYTFEEAAPAIGAAATATLATVAFAFTETGRYAFGLFSRIKGPAVLEQPRREALYAAVRQQPGVRFGQLRRDFALGNGVLAHHLSALEREGLIRRLQRGVHVHFLPTGHAPEPELLASPAGNAVLRAAAGAGWHAQADLARLLGLSRQAVHDQVRRLHREGLLELDERGRVRRRPPASPR
jgi:hypothetical protein